ncbi:sigma-54-dependent transcriptional regulator [Sulfurirhabdus autotrophica]|uniref:Two-component system response regulator HydG n=1 Tax=Sulfurirhabdus autotrophica TaxID=1706046 RepID=A0A4R3YCQ6_9PROT|nr:sigma-54 dependent transcriptional regulator [Sulfurirhabdus autotrophica]TCV89631.1 two-component system response regulator HydG [Sulfurirhabdus autotrophica]
MAKKILIVECEETLRININHYLAAQGFDTECRTGNENIVSLLEHQTFDVLIDCMCAGNEDGLDLLRHVRKVSPSTAVIVTTDKGSMDSAIKAFRTGACDYLIKPFQLEELKQKIENICHLSMISGQNIALRSEIRKRHDSSNIIGKSRAMIDLMKKVEKIAQCHSNVLITGETGTGKELVARAIHDLSPNHDSVFIPLNVAAIPENLVESHFFGHVRGAFSGADRAREGIFRAASGGTLFLDEIGEMALAIQPKLLRALEEKEILPLGSDVPLKVNARVITATHRNLERMVEANTFRQDLLFRLNVVNIHIPPLRERREDIPLLARHFISRHCRELGKPVFDIDHVAMQNLVDHDWSKGNIRELSNAIERAVIMCESGTLNLDDLLTNVKGNKTPPANLQSAAEKFEAGYIQSVLESVNGRRELAAKKLGISLATLYRCIKKHRQIDPECCTSCSKVSTSTDLSGGAGFQQTGFSPPG